MATVFPNSVDLFANPTSIKIDGEDLVRAAHVNDLQDGLAATQIFLITPNLNGGSFTWSANKIPDNTCIVDAIKALDTAAQDNEDDLAAHIGYVLVADPTQHHANVIAVTAGGNLSSTRLQTALEEHQVDIDAIMSGGTVEGVTLDDRYVRKSTSQTMDGPLTITQTLTVNGNTTLGNALTDTVAVAGLLAVGSDATLSGELGLAGNLTMVAGKFVGVSQYGGMVVVGNNTELRSKEDLIFQVDADDTVDGGPFSGTFRWKDGLGNDILTLTESGDLTLLTGSLLNLTTLDLSTALNVETGTNQAKYLGGAIKTNKPLYQIDLDNDADETGERFVVTKNNGTGILTSADTLLDVDANATLTTGIHKLKTGIQETGIFGTRDVAQVGGAFFGAGVNFKHVMSNPPSSITLTPVSQTNIQNLSVVYSDEFGFYFEFESVAGGDVKVYGRYTTVGN